MANIVLKKVATAAPVRHRLGTTPNLIILLTKALPENVPVGISNKVSAVTTPGAPIIVCLAAVPVVISSNVASTLRTDTGISPFRFSLLTAVLRLFFSPWP